jgi:hypothetical protein
MRRRRPRANEDLSVVIDNSLALGAAQGVDGRVRDESYRRQANERYRKLRPFGYAPRRHARRDV